MADVNPQPVIVLDGQFLDCSVSTTCPITGDKVLPDHGLTLLGEMSLDWGRDDAFSQPGSTVLNLVMWDPLGTWLHRIAARDAIGKPLAIWFDRPDAQDGRTVRYLFQGFTTNIDVVADNIRTTCGATDGYRVEVQATDRSGFLGNVEWFSGELPNEKMIDRAVRVRNQAAPLGIREMYFENRYIDGMVRSTDVSTATALDTANAIYESFAQAWTYNPDRNVMTRIPAGSRFDVGQLYLGVMGAVPSDDGDTGRIIATPPKFLDPVGTVAPIDVLYQPSGYIPGCQVTSEVALQSSTMSDITTVSCKWNDAYAGGDQWTTIIHTRDVMPRRLLRFDSLFENGTYIDTVLEDVVRYVSDQATRPFHPPIRWDTNRHGPIPNWDTFEVLTRPSQTVSVVAIAGSPFTAALNLPPFWHIAGGMIRYAEGHWDITANPAPAAIKLPPGFAPITWADLESPPQPTPISWADDVPGEHWHLDGSLDYYTLSYVGDPTVYLHK